MKHNSGWTQYLLWKTLYPNRGSVTVLHRQVKHVLGAPQKKSQKSSQWLDYGTRIPVWLNKKLGSPLEAIQSHWGIPCRKDRTWWEILGRGNREPRTPEMVMLSLWPHIPCSVFFFFICTQDEHESGQTSLLPLSAPRTAMDNRASSLCEAKLKKSCPHHHHTHSKMSSLTSRVTCRYCEPQRIVSPSALVRTHLHSLPMYLTLSPYSEPLKRGMRQN